MSSLGLRHLVRRRKSQQPLQRDKPPRRPTLLQMSFDIIIYPVAFLAPLALLPQVWQVYATHNVSSLSLPTWVLLGISNLLWICYGAVHNERPIIATNTLFALFNLAVAAGILLYR